MPRSTCSAACQHGDRGEVLMGRRPASSRRGVDRMRADGFRAIVNRRGLASISADCAGRPRAVLDYHGWPNASASRAIRPRYVSGTPGRRDDVTIGLAGQTLSGAALQREERQQAATRLMGPSLRASYHFRTCGETGSNRMADRAGTKTESRSADFRSCKLERYIARRCAGRFRLPSSRKPSITARHVPAMLSGSRLPRKKAYRSQDSRDKEAASGSAS